MNRTKKKHAIAPGPAKIEKFGWAAPGDRGRYRKINEALLHFAAYQREEVSLQNTRSIAADFDWEKFGTLTVMERTNGSLYVVDGRQRLSAVRLRGLPSEADVPCMVYRSEGIEHEARAFLVLNKNRKQVTAVDRHNAAVIAKMEPYVSIDNYIRGAGYVIGTSAHTPNVISFPAQITSAWSANEYAAKSAIDFVFGVCGDDDKPSVEVFKGAYWLECRGVKLSTHVDKVRQMGKATVLKNINTVLVEQGQVGRNGPVCGAGLLKTINYKLKRKVRIQQGREDT